VASACALAGEKPRAYSDEVVMPALLEAARAASIARGGQTGSLQAWLRAASTTDRSGSVAR
jgi:hypothetical protein